MESACLLACVLASEREENKGQARFGLTTTDELPCWRHWTRYAASEGLISLLGATVDMAEFGEDDF